MSNWIIGVTAGAIVLALWVLWAKRNPDAAKRNFRKGRETFHENVPPVVLDLDIVVITIYLWNEVIEAAKHEMYWLHAINDSIERKPEGVHLETYLKQEFMIKPNRFQSSVKNITVRLKSS